MSAANARSNTFNELFLNDSYQDASTVSMELDKGENFHFADFCFSIFLFIFKGLRSTNIGEQCEAIVRFPKLFEKYPFPIVINANFLKLAEFFRLGSNLFRLWVLRVCQQSEKHLEKITNVDEFVKRIFMVIHSNDPVARSLTLRTLGSVASIIPEQQQVHHAIRKALDSHDTVEVEAAIYASVQFAAQSKTFAISMCSKVASMIESLQTPVNMKLQLIPVLRHMHHDANTAALVKTLCINLLPKYPSENFICVTLDSLSQLSCATLVDIPDQVKLLISYLQDPRTKVRLCVLRSLQSLAEKGAHLWPFGSVNSLISVAKSVRGDGSEQGLVLAVVLTLTKCPLIAGSKEEEGRILELCTSCFKTVNHKTNSLAIAILTSVISYCHVEEIPPPQAYLNAINSHHEKLILSCLKDDAHIQELCKYLKCGVQLAEKNDAMALEFTRLVGRILTEEQQLNQKQSELICETLAALCSHFMKERYQKISEKQLAEAMEVDEAVPGNPFHELLPSLLKRLENLIFPKFDPKHAHFIEILAAVCLQSMMGFHMHAKMHEIFKKVLTVISKWSQYRIARSASRYGHPFIAARIYQQLSKHVSQEKFYFYLSGLMQISTAECILLYGHEFEDLEKKLIDGKHKENQMNLVQRLEKSITHYWKALATFKASSSHIHSLSFQTEYVWLRASFLEALLSIVIARNTQYITPPPAIAQTCAQNSRDPLQKFGHITNQFRKCVKSLKVCEENYSLLYKSAFDADPCTLEQLEITQHLCAVFGHSLETICFTTSQDSLNIPTQGNFPETAFGMATCSKITREFEKLPVETSGKSITNVHTDIVLKQIEMAITSPICIPRFFFQVQQNTSIKLSMSPFPRVAGEAILVQSGHNLVVKVEGVIVAKPSLYRSIESVQLTLTSQLLTPRAIDVKPINDTITLVQTTKPSRDFLSANFLLSLNQNGGTGQQWQVTLESCIIDGNGVLWNTLGPKK